MRRMNTNENNLPTTLSAADMDAVQKIVQKNETDLQRQACVLMTAARDLHEKLHRLVAAARNLHDSAVASYSETADSIHSMAMALAEADETLRRELA